MIRYSPLQEELLQGVITSGITPSEKGMVTKIEALSEYNKMKKGCRGIIVDSKLYMCNNPNVIHEDIRWFLISTLEVDRKLLIHNDFNYDDALNKFMTVQKGERVDALFVGESYDPPVKMALKRYPNNEKKDKVYIKQIEDKFKSIAYLKVPFKIQCIEEEDR